MNPSRPSGPGWEAYKRTELEYIKQHGKSSGKYYIHDGQRWRLDRKAEAGKPVRYSPKSVDVKNKENAKDEINTKNRIFCSFQPGMDMEVCSTCALHPILAPHNTRILQKAF